MRQEIPCNTVYEDDNLLAFHDINPEAPVHVLIVPKGEYISFMDFSTLAEPEEIKHFFQTVHQIALELGLELGYKLQTNVGKVGGQEVPHFHVHLLGKK